MRNVTFWLTVIAFALLFSPLSAQQAEIALSVNSSHTLPGVPVGLSLVFRNTSPKPVTLKGFLFLKVIPEDGKPFIAQWELNSEAAPIPFPAQSLKLSPGQSKQIFYSLDPSLTSPAWFFDSRLSWPGTYRLQILVASSQQELPNSLASSEAVLVVDEPHGEDALVWQRMVELSQGKGWGGNQWVYLGFTISKEIWEQHRTSNYLPYVAAMVPLPETDKIVVNEQAINMFPTSPMIDSLHASTANLYLLQMQRAFQAKDLAKARQLYDKKQQDLQAVLAHSKDPILKERTQGNLKSWDDHLKDDYENRFKVVQ